MKRFYFSSFFLILTIAFISLFRIIPVNALYISSISKTPPPPTINEQNLIDVEQAIRNAIYGEVQLMPARRFIDTKIDNLEISQDKQWAVAWLNPIDPESGEIIPTEPGLAVAKNKGEEWTAILPSYPNWVNSVEDAPEDLLSPEDKKLWLEMNSRLAGLAAAGPFGGYLLPWAGGITMAMTQSVKHDKYTPSGNAHYSFDFATPGTPQMFNLYASKAGTVKQRKDDCTNGSESCSNWVVLEDTTTNPTTYQLYLHLAKNSIPDNLSIGSFVAQGELIGVADDTGVSTGHHLHFMVHTNPSSYWGTSVDITFSEVSINGGRPRITADIPYCRNDATYHDVCEQFSNLYVSSNYPSGDRTPPYGDILNPFNGALVEASTVTLEGWANDSQTGLASAQFIARYNETWHDVGPDFSTIHFSANWDMCTASVPDGPVSLALRLRDNAGNQTTGLVGLRHFTKNFTCPTPAPACIPTSNQIALFAGPDFNGACVVLGTGSFTSFSLGSLGDDNAESIQVGSNVMSTLFFNNNYTGRGETFLANDSNLADNLISKNTTTSLIVSARTPSPTTPALIWPTNSSSFPGSSSLSLVWDNRGNATEFQAEITGPGGTRTSPWLKTTYWNLGSLNPGIYSWKARARNTSYTGSWSSQYTFTISSNPSTPAAVTVPYTESVESVPSNWTKSAYWDFTNLQNHTLPGSISFRYDINGTPQQGYDTGNPNTGDLTSPPIALPEEGEYYLRFWYYFETESPGLHWDQRWVQISVNGGPFTNTLQLSDDPANTWLQSPVIPLTQYSGQTMRIRFHFETMDKWLNTYQGWYIDDISVNSIPPPSCNGDTEPNDTPSQAIPINYNSARSGVICPGGDKDYFVISGAAGDRLGAFVEAAASNPASQLDPYLFLYDSDSVSVLAENDDQVLAQITDSEIAYKLLRPGNYYMKIRAWDHPSGGSEAHSYTFHVYNDGADPLAAFSFPADGSILPHEVINLVVVASDNLSGVSHVQFLWHPADWQNGVWTVIGEDWNSQDGWSIPFDASQISLQMGMAVYAKVYDRSGNWIGIGSWNLSNPKARVFFPAIRK